MGDMGNMGKREAALHDCFVNGRVSSGDNGSNSLRSHRVGPDKSLRERNEELA